MCRGLSCVCAQLRDSDIHSTFDLTPAQVTQFSPLFFFFFFEFVIGFLMFITLNYCNMFDLYISVGYLYVCTSC